MSDTRYLVDHINHVDLIPAQGVGPWQTFTPDAGWGNSTLRYRRVPAGLQFEGIATNNQPQNTTIQLGTLPTLAPQRQQVMMIGETGSGGYGYGFLVFNVNGTILCWFGIAATQIYPSGIVALD